MTKYELRFALQKVNVIGHIKNQNILVKPEVIDAGLLYLTSIVKVVSFNLQNNGRVVVPFKVELPGELSEHVKLKPSKGYIRVGLSLDISVRICLKYR